jgi:hypothetical protein
MHTCYAFTCRYKVVLVLAHQKESPSESFAAPAYDRSQAMPDMLHTNHVSVMLHSNHIPVMLLKHHAAVTPVIVYHNICYSI